MTFTHRNHLQRPRPRTMRIELASTLRALCIVVCLCGLVVTLGGCQKTISKVLSSASQKIPSSQGNLMFRADIARIRLGMSKDEVQFILGAPLLLSSFEKNRWYYLFYLNDKPIDELNQDIEEYTFTLEKDSERWVEYWQNGGPPIVGTDASVKTATEERSEQDVDETREDADLEAEEQQAEQITTVRRSQFLESKTLTPGSTRVVFYGRMTLVFESNNLSEIYLLDIL